MINKKYHITNIIITSIIIVTIFVLILLYGPGNQDIGALIFLLLLFGLAIILLISNFFRPKSDEKNTTNKSIGLTYTYSPKKPVPIGSIFLTIISLCVYLISDLKNYGSDTAIALFIAFGMLAMIEYLINWYRITKYQDCTFSFDNHGVTVSKGVWNKEYPWSNYRYFAIPSSLKFKQILSLLPLSLIFLSEFNKNNLKLYRKDEYRHDYEIHGQIATDETKNIRIDYDEIITLPEYKKQVIEFIKQYLPMK